MFQGMSHGSGRFQASNPWHPIQFSIQSTLRKSTFLSLDAAADGYGGVMVTSNPPRGSFLGRELLCIYIYIDIDIDIDIVYILCMDIYVYMAK